MRSGILVPRGARQVILKAPDGKRGAIPADRVLSLSLRKTFSMPDLPLRDMSAQDVADRIEYLLSLNR